ncbi:hypothetical protein [Pleionea sp. CnH1-48]|uniref:hypothetical protein n=1 Tax=Pleionea sp. CnH1-48 TaxID=2954494 RepID=UPI002096EC28|nr:hypothetical protein [Pleionea sp. CnH1-48]MCO7223419.1 hypothetical protein [Pleionea sp. CnH1-48]
MPISYIKHALLLLFTLGFSISGFSADNVEEKRLKIAERRIPEVVSAFDPLLDQFKQQAKPIKSKKLLRQLVEDSSRQLWRLAVERMKKDENLDDRALYWARLSLRKIVKGWKRNKKLKEKMLQQYLDIIERNTRGIFDIRFKDDADIKVLLTGFDPFFLDRFIGQSNPSGIAALWLDGKVFEHEGKTIAIETAMIPVRYQDFDEGMIESLLRPYFKQRKVDMIVTVSMGREQFDLERFPGLRRSAKAPDNLNVYTGATPQNPLAPLSNGKQLKGKEFVEFSLPVKAMLTIQSPYSVKDNHRVSTLEKTFEPKSLKQLEGQTSVRGSGGGYLSNEISYRSIRLRNKLKSTIPVGHIHTPKIAGFDPKASKNIITQVKKMVLAGAASTK